MMTSNELARLYDTLLCIPGMNELVKLDLRITRKQVLLLTQVIERGLKAEAENPSGILKVSQDPQNELGLISKDCLEKAGLIELSSKLKALESK